MARKRSKKSDFNKYIPWLAVLGVVFILSLAYFAPTGLFVGPFTVTASGNTISYSGTCDSGGVDVGITISVSGQPIPDINQHTVDENGFFAGTHISDHSGDHTVTAQCAGETSSVSQTICLGAGCPVEEEAAPSGGGGGGGSSGGSRASGGTPETMGAPSVQGIDVPSVPAAPQAPTAPRTPEAPTAEEPALAPSEEKAGFAPLVSVLLLVAAAAGGYVLYKRRKQQQMLEDDIYQ